MTKIFRSIFYRRTKQAEPLEEEEESLAAAAAGGYRDLEDGTGRKHGDETPGSGGARCDDDNLCFVAYLATCVGIGYMLLGSFYLPPEAGADGGREVAIVGLVVLAVGVPVLVATCRCSRRRGSSAASAVER